MLVVHDDTIHQQASENISFAGWQYIWLVQRTQRLRKQWTSGKTSKKGGGSVTQISSQEGPLNATAPANLCCSTERNAQALPRATVISSSTYFIVANQEDSITLSYFVCFTPKLGSTQVSITKLIASHRGSSQTTRSCFAVEAQPSHNLIQLHSFCPRRWKDDIEYWSDTSTDVS